MVKPNKSKIEPAKPEDVGLDGEPEVDEQAWLDSQDPADGEVDSYSWPQTFLAGDPGREDEEIEYGKKIGFLDDQGRPTKKYLDFIKRYNARLAKQRK